MTVVLWILQILLALIFVSAGGMKIATPATKLAEKMTWVKSAPNGSVKVLGVLEVAAAVGLILPPIVNIAVILTPLAAVGCACIMAGAVIVHARGKETPMVAMTTVIFLVSVFVAVGRFGPWRFS